MKALTIRQPWATCIAAGAKDVENRTQLWRHRGELAIHAGAGWSVRGGRSPLVHGVYLDLLAAHGWTPMNGRQAAEESFATNPTSSVPRTAYRTAAILAVATLADVHRCTLDPGSITYCCESPWAETEYQQADGTTRYDLTHLVLTHVRELADPVPVKGRLGLWDLLPDVEAAVQDQIRPGDRQDGADR